MDRSNDRFARLKQLLPPAFEMFRDNDMAVYSGYATLFIVTSLIPFVILIITVVNLLPGFSTKDVSDLLIDVFPVLDSSRDLIETALTNVKNQSGGLLASTAAVTTLWSASKGVMAIQRGLNQLDDKPADAPDDIELEEIAEKGKGAARNVAKRLIFTVMLVILIPAILVFEMLRKAVIHFHTFFGGSSLAVIGFSFLAILLIYALLPAKRRTLKSQLPGTIFTGVVWVVFTELFSFFITKFYHASNLYGSLASVFMILLWLRYVVMILFAGGVLNRTIEKS